MKIFIIGLFRFALHWKDCLLKICETEQIDVSGFGENTFDGIKYYTKSTSRLYNPKLQALFTEINKKNENEIVRKLKGWTKLLKEKNYKVVINELVNA